MKIVAISDTHNQLDKIKIPQCDLLIHSGDLTMSGTVPELAQAAADLRALKTQRICKNIVCVAGNHDFGLERDPYVTEYMFADLGYLRDSFKIIDGLTVYGAPWTPRFFDWAFNVDRGYDIRQVWNTIPDDIDILITHGPPMNILDYSPYGKVHAGCEELALAVQRVKPKLHCFGHFHGEAGWTQHKDTLFVNASTCDEKYRPVNKPIVINYDGENFEVDNS